MSALHPRCGRPRITAMKTAALLAALALTAAPAAAHDTWFEPLPDGSLTLGTGNRYPVMELAVDDKFFARRGIR